MDYMSASLNLIEVIVTHLLRKGSRVRRGDLDRVELRIDLGHSLIYLFAQVFRLGEFGLTFRQKHIHSTELLLHHLESLLGL